MLKGPLMFKLALSFTRTEPLIPSKFTLCAILPATIVGITLPINVALFPSPLLSIAVVPETEAESKLNNPVRLLVIPPPPEDAAAA
jgi:hypothetical protein